MKCTQENFNKLKNDFTAPTIVHKSCSGTLRYSSGDFKCNKCNVTWRPDTISRMTEEQMDLRFEIQVPADNNTYKLVQKEEKGQSYYTLEKVEKPNEPDLLADMEKYFKDWSV
jgi:hypothetical protein